MTPAESEHLASTIFHQPTREEALRAALSQGFDPAVVGLPIVNMANHRVYRALVSTSPGMPSLLVHRPSPDAPVEFAWIDSSNREVLLFRSLYDLDDLEVLALADKYRPQQAKPNSSVRSNIAEINRLLKKMPSEWRNQLDSSRHKLRAAGARAHEIPSQRVDVKEALKALNLNNQGAISSEAGALERGEPVPEDVRQAAMEGIRLSYKNNYGGYDFIGVARAIQLATMPSISPQAKNRMRMYFDRKYTQDRLSDQYREKFGKRYWSWLNWGGDPGSRWSGSSKMKRTKINASSSTRASRLVGWYSKVRHAGGSYG